MGLEVGLRGYGVRGGEMHEKRIKSFSVWANIRAPSWVRVRVRMRVRVSGNLSASVPVRVIRVQVRV